MSGSVEGVISDGHSYSDHLAPDARYDRGERAQASALIVYQHAEAQRERSDASGPVASQGR